MAVCRIRVKSEIALNTAQVAGIIFSKLETAEMRVEQVTDEIKLSPLLEVEFVADELPAPTAPSEPAIAAIADPAAQPEETTRTESAPAIGRKKRKG